MHTASQATVTFQLIRNATIKLSYPGATFLVDPMLAPKDACPGFAGTYNSHLRYPLVELPLALDEILQADAVIVTHTHADHWDAAARAMIPKRMPVFAQDGHDAAAIRKDGFLDVRVFDDGAAFAGTQLVRTRGQHGTDGMMAVPALAERMGRVSGVIFVHPGCPTVYVAGDTVWTGEVEQAIVRHRPDVIVLNTGYARVLGMDGAIIMGKEDLERAHRLAPQATVIGIHMEAVNHGMQTRRELREFIALQGLDATRVLVPEDGASCSFQR